jgi:hypothetical protein
MSLSSKNTSCIDGLRILLEQFDKENNEDVPKALTQKLEKLIDSYDVSIEEDTKDMRILKDYLQSEKGLMRQFQTD